MTLALRSVECSGMVSERLLRAVAPFGLLVRSAPRHEASRAVSATHHADPVVVDRLLAMPTGTIVLLTGPSGCGKSTLLRDVASAARHNAVRVLEASTLLTQAGPDRPIIDLFSLSILQSLRVLSAAGLGEAMLWARSAQELSEGQRARLGIALAMARATTRRDTLLLLDEFCSTLDRVTARCVARTLRRWSCQQPRVRVICASAHNDLAEALSPDLLYCMENRESAS